MYKQLFLHKSHNWPNPYIERCMKNRVNCKKAGPYAEANLQPIIGVDADAGSETTGRVDDTYSPHERPAPTDHAEGDDIVRLARP